MNWTLDEQRTQAICDVLADTNHGFTQTELKKLLSQCQIEAIDDGKKPSSGGMYTAGLNKRTWLYQCFAYNVNRCNSYDGVKQFIEKSMNPVNFTADSMREKSAFLFEGLNKIFLLMGWTLTKEGRLKEAVQAKTLDEVDRRVNELRRHLYHRAIHHEVEKYCIQDYLRKDYYDAVFEAAKGLAERVRQLSGLVSDGSELFQKAFAKKDPYIAFNALKTPSEESEFSGLKELMESIFHLVRNPAAHTPKLNWKTDETKALDILTIISFAHKYLDECYKVPGK